MDRDLKVVADDYWNGLLEAGPSFSTSIGDHRFDDRAEDYSAEADHNRRRWLADLQKGLEGVDRASLSTEDGVSASLLREALDDWAVQIDHRVIELQSDNMRGPHTHAFDYAQILSYPEPEHAEMLIERYRGYGDMFDGAASRFLDGAARGWNPVAAVLDRSLGQLDGYLATARDADLFVNVDGPQDWDGEDAWRARLGEVVGSVVRPALHRYRSVLAERLRPGARGDDRPGLCWLEDGDGLYTALVRANVSQPMDPHEVHETGLAELRRLDGEFAELGSTVFDLHRGADVRHRLRDGDDLRFGSVDEIVSLAEAAIGRSSAAMGHWFGRLPEAPCVVTTVPEYLADGAPPAYYFDPAPDGSRPGTYFVNPREPQTQPRFDAEATAFHEAIPGHHLQLAIAVELAHLHPFRRYTECTSFIEGWALYAERLADEMGLYSGDLARLGRVASEAFRAARLVADTGLHAKGWSRTQALEFFADATTLAPVDVEAEIDRYIGMPAQALSYKLGELHLAGVRRRSESVLGERFDITAFHDAVLSSGTLTLPVLDGVVDRWLATAT